jgi:hypothetical protein
MGGKTFKPVDEKIKLERYENLKRLKKRKMGVWQYIMPYCERGNIRYIFKKGGFGFRTDYTDS